MRKTQCNTKQHNASILAVDLAAALDPIQFAVSAGLSPDPWQARLLRSTASNAIVCCSRQAGKSTTTALLALHKAIFRPGSLILLVSPSLRQSAELFKKVWGFYQEIGRPVATELESSLRAELKNGSRILSLPGKPETIRGFSGVDLLVVDEASWVSDSLYYSVRPMLAVSKGKLVALSTPFGKRGWFYEAFENGGPGWERFKVTAYDCPRISEEFLEAEKRSMPNNWFMSEYLCEFVDTEDSVFRYEDIMNALSDDVEPLF